MADEDPVEQGECNRKMGKVWGAIDGHNGMPGIRQQMAEVLLWQGKKDARDEAIKEALDLHYTRQSAKQNWMLILVTLFGIIASGIAMFHH